MAGNTFKKYLKSLINNVNQSIQFQYFKSITEAD